MPPPSTVAELLLNVQLWSAVAVEGFGEPTMNRPPPVPVTPVIWLFWNVLFVACTDVPVPTK